MAGQKETLGQRRVSLTHIWDTGTLQWIPASEAVVGGAVSVTNLNEILGVDDATLSDVVDAVEAIPGGGGVQYTEGDTDASITGTAILWEDAADTLVPVSAANPLPVDATVNASIDTTGLATDTKQDEQTALLTSIDGKDFATQTTLALIKAKTDNIDVALSTRTKPADQQHVIVDSSAAVAVTNAGLTALDGAIAGTEVQVDVLTMPTVAVTQSGAWDEVGINDSGNSITVDAPVGTPVFVRLSDGASAIATLPVSIAAAVTVAQATAANLNVTEASAASILTSVQLIDDVVFVDDTATHATGTTKGVGIMAAATPTDGSVNANDIGMLAMTTDRRLLVDASGVAVPVTDNAGSLSVDWNGTQPVTGSGNATGALRVELANNGTGLVGLNAGTNAIGKLAANSGIDIGDVDVTSVVPGTGATNLGKAEDAGHSSGDAGVMLLGVVDNSPDTARADADNDYVPISLTNTGAVRIAPISEDFAVLANGPQVKKYYTNAGAVTDGIVWSPAAGKRWYVTDIIINVSAACTVTFEDDKAGGDEAVAKFEFAANSGMAHSFNTPWFSGEDAADLLVTTSAGNIYITITGYEI